MSALSSARSASSSRSKSTARSSASAKKGGFSSRSSVGGSGSDKKKKKKKGSKKKKKKPIIEDPKLVRDLLAHVDKNDFSAVSHFINAPEYDRKWDFVQNASEAVVIAAEKNHADCLTALLERGAPPNGINGKPLQRAAKAGSLETVELLLSKGADPNATAHFTEYTPLHYACQNGSLAVVKILVEKGAKFQPSHAEQCAQFSGWTPLHFACDHGHLPAVAYLLSKGHEIDVLNSTGDTALGIAAERGKWDCARWLVAAGANIHAKRRGLNIVQWAIYRGDSPAVQYLVSYGALPMLTTRVLWFPPDANLKDVIFKQFSEAIYDEIDLAIYRGGKQGVEREAKKRIVASIQWESSPMFDPYSFDPNPANVMRNFPEHIVQLISSYEM